MTVGRAFALTLALFAAACSSTSTSGIPSLATGDDRLSADNSPGTILRVADATRAGGDPASAIGLYRRVHELTPQDPAPLARLGATFVQLHAFTEAAEAYRQAVELAPNDVETRRGYGILLLTIDKPQLALTQLDAALAQRKDAKTYNLVGVANDLIGRHELAQLSYADGLRLAPDNLPLRNNLGLSQALASDFGAAIKTLSDAAASPHATARTRQNLALVYGLAGNGDKAAAVARTDLDEASVQSNIAYYAMLRGMDDRARAAAIVGARVPAPASEPQTAAVEPAASPSPAPRVTVEATPLAPPAPPIAASPAPRPVQAATAPAKRAPRPLEPRAVAKSEEPAPLPAPPQAEITDAAPVQTPAQPSGNPQAEVASPPAAQLGPAAPSTAQVEPAAPPTAQVEPMAPPAAEAPHDEAAPNVSAATAPVRSPEPPAAAALPTKTPMKRGFLVQVGAFHDPARAHRLCNELAAKGYDLAVSAAQGEARDWFFCRSTAASDRTDAIAAAQHLREAENAPALVVPATATN